MTTGNTIALTRQTLVGKVTSLVLNILSRLVVTFLPKSKHLLIYLFINWWTFGLLFILLGIWTVLLETLNISVHVFMWTCTFNSLGYIPKSRILGHFCLTFWGIVKLFSKMGVPFYFLTYMCFWIDLKSLINALYQLHTLLLYLCTFTLYPFPFYCCSIYFFFSVSAVKGL